MPRAEPALKLGHAITLGLVQGPAELLPVSSSAHTALVPWLAGWPYTELDGELRKSFEVALHAGTALALALEMSDELGDFDRERVILLVLSLGPAALAGYLFREPIERRLGDPVSIAAGLILGGFAMALTDQGAGGRTRADAGALDGLLLGVAQASALIPGVSRHGATLTAARARGFARGPAQALSWETGLPVILAAVALKGSRLLRHGVPASARAPLAAGAASAFLSTLASARVLRDGRRSGRALAPYALYRCLLALLVLGHGRRGGR
ncbi:MAG TPA: undecaprenyl-diphosphate phosphatase [Solirubrobacteraceae bacterium]